MNYRSYDRAHSHPVLGIDEVGTGAVAGPIYAAGCIIPWTEEVLGTLQKLRLQDSKQMSRNARERVYEFLTNLPEFRYWIVNRHPEEIKNIGQHECIAAMINEIIAWRYAEIGGDGVILIDGQKNNRVAYQANWILKGDTKSLTIAAASVIAKVTRDNFMEEAAWLFPVYGFAENAGYYTEKHKEALEHHGPCILHRQNTRPVQEAMEALRRQFHVFSQTSCPVAVSLEKVR